MINHHHYVNYNLPRIMKEFRKEFPGRKLLSRKEMIDMLVANHYQKESYKAVEKELKYLYLKFDITSMSKNEILAKIKEVYDKIEAVDNPMDINDDNVIKSVYELHGPAMG